jgi:hypothetical protein
MPVRVTETAVCSNRPFQVSTKLWMVTAFCAALALAAVVIAHFGSGERGTDIALQLTARWSFLLFCPAYSGSAFAALFGVDRVKRGARNFGLAFASAHLVHIGLVAWVCQIGAAPPIGSFVFFGIALVWTYLLALLSIDRLRRTFGRRVWWLLNAVGLNYIALAFAADFIRFPYQSDARYLVGYLPFIVLSIAGPVLRAAAFMMRIHRSWRSPASPIG